MKLPECDHDFEECEVFNPYNYNLKEFKLRDSNQKVWNTYLKKSN